MSTVFLHIGTAKTGTTAIQRFLPMNREILNRNGYEYPEMPFHFPRIGHGRNAHFLSLHELYADKEKWADRWDRGFEVVKEALKYDRVIMSDEILWAMHVREGYLDRMVEGFRKIGADLKIVVYLRRQDEMAESHWNQMVKGKPKLTQGFTEFVTKGVYATFPLDYGKGLDTIASYVGKENMIVRPYEKRQFVKGSLFADFLDAVGLELTDEYEFPEHVVNTRLPENVVEIKRLINEVDSYRDKDVPNYFREVIRQAYGLEMMKDVPEHKTGRFSDEERRRYMNHFEEGNVYVAREYLHRASGVLFSESLGGLAQWKPDGWEMMKDVVRVLAGANVYEYKKNRELEERVKALEKQLARQGNTKDKVLDEHKAVSQKLRKDLHDIQEQVKEMYNSAIFRTYRRFRGKKHDD